MNLIHLHRLLICWIGSDLHRHDLKRAILNTHAEIMLHRKKNCKKEIFCKSEKRKYNVKKFPIKL